MLLGACPTSTCRRGEDAAVRRGRGTHARLELLEPEEGEGGNEWVTCGPHMLLRCRPAFYVAVNASVAWSKPLNFGQNSIPRLGAKSERF